MRAVILSAGPVCLVSIALVAQAQDQPPPPAPPPVPVPAVPASTPAATPPTPTPPPVTSTAASASSAASPPVPETGFELGARIAFSAPFGNLQQQLKGAMPLWIDAGRRFSKQLVLGIYGYAAVAFPVVGAGYGFGIGGEGQYFFSQTLFGLNPWLGAAFGYETAGVSFMGANTTTGGPEGGVQVGLDYKRGFGPFAAFTVGSYSSYGVDEWITIGMRGTYDW
jgi:hypothetical protein